MESLDHRQIISQLGDDFAWLEEHCRQQPDLAARMAEIRFAASLVRNVIGPFLNGQKAEPLHLVVVGGAGAGKSTVVNFLVGSVVAEANPQAGFTRHPVAYVSGTSAISWTSHLGVLKPLQRVLENVPSSRDEDIWQVRRVATAEGGFGPLGDCVVWDCPDMTTWAAGNYVSRLVEISGMADAILYVASDERYNDEVPTQFLQMLIRTGKPVIVCITKMREADAPRFIEHFQKEVLSRIQKNAGTRANIAVIAIPFLKSEQLADLQGAAAKYRIPLLNQVAVLCDPPEGTRKRTVRAAITWLTSSGEGLLASARQDLEALENWKLLVQTAELEFDSRYRREYLIGERLRRLDQSREQILNLLELPGAGRLFSAILWVLRSPYRLIRGLMERALLRPESVNLGEHDVLDAALRAWMDQLRAESIRRTEQHPLWKHISNGFASGLGVQANEKFENEFRRFQLNVADAVEAGGSSIPAMLESSLPLLVFLRAGKLILDVAAVALGLWAANFTWWSLLVIPVFTSITHQIVELIVWQIVEQKREQTRSRKQALMSQYISVPLGDWLTQWPATGGSAYERLQTTLRRIPQAVKDLAARLKDAGVG